MAALPHNLEYKLLPLVDASNVSLGSFSFAGGQGEPGASEAAYNGGREGYADERTLYEAAVLLVRGLAGIRG